MRGITLEWKGGTHRIPPEKAFLAGEAVEDIVPLAELVAWGSSPKFHKLARVVSVLLRFAGVKATPEEVHAEMMSEIKKAGGDPENMIAARGVSALVDMLMDGAPEADGGDAPEKPDAS